MLILSTLAPAPVYDTDFGGGLGVGVAVLAVVLGADGCVAVGGADDAEDAADGDDGALATFVLFVPRASTLMTEATTISSTTARIPAAILCLRHQGRFAEGGLGGRPCTGGVGGIA